ncbi:mechanosensitive ion channel family protein [Hippea jasoniae]|uniref:mechanosensitive ion channel family protein n=1 Tax=Hippea jasoniae TaxID=944479 RepID=UPI00068C9174|nr:mechanosensitive ion channel domain-containing protein [Hippea jasoniae]
MIQLRKLLFVIIISLFVINAHADTSLNNILNKINKNSLDYSYAKILVYKINQLKPAKITCNCNIKNQNQAAEKFLLIVGLQKQIYNLNNKIIELTDKINVLENTPIAKLQKIYYTQYLKILTKQKTDLINNIPEWEKTLYNQLKNINFNLETALHGISEWNKKLFEINKKIEKLKIDLQKWELLENKNMIDQTHDLINKYIETRKEINLNLLKNSLIIWLEKLKNKDKSVFKYTQTLLIYTSDPLFKAAFSNVTSDFEKLTFKKSYYLYNSSEEIKNVIRKIFHILSFPLFSVNKKEITPFDLIIFILILITGWLVGKYYKKIILSIGKTYEINFSTLTLLTNTGYYFILTLSFLIALKVIGLDLSSLAIIAGALSVGIGFGLQNIVSNFVSGIILMFEKSIKVGDYIEIDNDTRGEVMDISMRSTILKTNDNINLIIPNQTFVQNQVINWTMTDELVRFRVPFGVAYATDIEKMEKILIEALLKSNLPFVKNKDEETSPKIVFIEMGNSSLNFELFVWVKGKYARTPRRTKSQFLKFIYLTLINNGFEIPFPQNDIHFRNELEVKIKEEKVK